MSFHKHDHNQKMAALSNGVEFLIPVNISKFDAFFHHLECNLSWNETENVNYVHDSWFTFSDTAEDKLYL